MDFHLKQPIEKQQYHQEEEEESDHQPSPAKLRRLESHHNHNDTALPLFSSQQQSLNTFSYPDSKPPLPPSTSRFSTGLGGYFSSSQWQELELQALIFRHMVAGASVPPQLLQLVQKSLLDSTSFHLSNTNFSYYPQPSLYQAAGYWSKANMDPEPGRCRRTDGKKWRCSRDVVAGHKYCERHVHRGRNRSRKPVESSIPAAATVAAASNPTFRQSGLVGGDGTRFSLSGPTTSLDIFQLNQGVADPKPDGKSPYKAQNDQSGDSTSKLRHFFDDWPKPDNTGGIHGTSTVNSATCLSISTPRENPSVDFLKLSTGNGGDQLSRNVDDGEWSGANQADAMGGPLAEALRSSTGQLPQSASGASCVTA
ncbi:hypothetical protein V2J09_009636 [Rumex salicifolius]